MRGTRRLLSKSNTLLTLVTQPRRRKLFVVMALFVLLTLLLLLYISLSTISGEHYTSADDGQEFLIYSSEYFESWPGYKVVLENFPREDIPIIVWWTDGGSLNPHAFDRKHPPFAHLTCPSGAICYSTTDRSPKILADPRTRGLLFYGTDVEPMDLPLPRLKHHEWALIHEESPLNNYMLTYNSMIRQFNHTATFRRESDYPLSTQAIRHMDYLLSRQPVSIAKKNEEKKSRGLAPIVYVQSHCDVPSDRDVYVKELMKYIDIDSYGTCLNNKDLPDKLQDPAESFEHNDFFDLLSVYKFSLAFENAYCNDYMTEKIMRPLHIGVVPIYKGSPVIQDWMPNNHSVILVDNFSSPKELADFIKYLDENDHEYDKYLEFKRAELQNKFLSDHMEKREWSEGTKDYFRGFECYVCSELVTRMDAEKAHAKDPSAPLMPPKIADSSHLACPAPQRLDVGQGINQFWPEIDWTALYWDGVDKARAVQRMLEAGETDSQKFQTYLWKELEKHRYKSTEL